MLAESSIRHSDKGLQKYEGKKSGLYPIDIAGLDRVAGRRGLLYTSRDATGRPAMGTQCPVCSVVTKSQRLFEYLIIFMVQNSKSLNTIQYSGLGSETEKRL